LKVLVTGGAGFIGSNIVDALLNAGHAVAIVDDLSTGLLDNINPSAEFFQLDIRDKGVGKVLTDWRPDAVCHHAAQIDVRVSTEDPVFDADVNILGFLNLLESSKSLGARFVLASTSAVYGETERLPVDETAVVSPISPYGITKSVSEQYLRFYHETYGLSYTILRYGNVYGPRQNPYGDAGVIAIFSETMLDGRTPNIYGDGKQLRDYVYVSDVVAANLLALNHGYNGAFNIATGRGTSVLELFEAVKKLAGFTGQAVFKDKRAGELEKSYLDVSRARDILGWSPMNELKTGLSLTVEYFKSKHKGEDS